MKIGLVGYKGSGKSTLFKWLTGVEPDLSLSHSLQSATAPIPEPRFEALKKIYNPKKITGLSGYGLEVVERVPIAMRPHDENHRYLDTKRAKLGHMLPADILGLGV